MTSEDWNMVAAIGQCVGAAATLAAVSVALRAEYRASAIRLAIKTIPAVPPAQFIKGSDLRVVVVNRSNRPVTLMGGGVLLPNGNVSDNHNLQLNSLYQKTVKEWDRIEADIATRWLSDELDKQECKAQTKLRIFVEDATGRRHWVKAWFDPAPYIAQRKAEQQASLRATYKELAGMIGDGQESENPHVREESGESRAIQGS